MNKKYFIFLGLICIMITSIDVLSSYRYTNHLVQSIDTRKKELYKLYQYSIFLSQLKDAETGQRGYAITGNPTYLEPYESALNYLRSQEFLDFYLQELTDANPEITAKIQELHNLKEEKLKWLNENIDIRKNQGAEAAHQHIVTGQGKHLMDKIRQTVQSIIGEKINYLHQIDEEITYATKQTLLQFYISNAIAVFLITLCLIYIYRYLQKLLQKEKELATAKEQLSESLAMQQAIFNSASYAIIVTDPQGIITSFNPAAEKLFGYSSEEIVGKYTPEIIHVKEDMEEKSLEFFKKYHKKLEGFDLLTGFVKVASYDTKEWIYLHKDGTHFPAERSATTIKDSNNQIIGYVGIIHDISERKQIDKMRDELIAIAGFELREPIAAIKGMFDLLSLKSYALPDKAQYILDIGKRNCNHLVNIVNDIFEMQKIETGMVSFIFRKFNLSSFLSLVTHNLSSIASQAHVTLHYQPMLDSCMIEGDQDQIMRIMERLITDAIRRSPPGTTIDISVEKRDSKVRIKVTDQTLPEPPEFYLQTFSSSQSEHSNIDISKVSNYLGLRMAKSVIDKHHGKLGFDIGSKGASFWIELPIT